MSGRDGDRGTAVPAYGGMSDFRPPRSCLDSSLPGWAQALAVLGADLAPRVLQPLDAAEQANARVEEPYVERLDHIIIGASLKAGDLVMNAGALRQEHDGHLIRLGQEANLLA
jgi:hypothetical protein